MPIGRVIHPASCSWPSPTLPSCSTRVHIWASSCAARTHPEGGQTPSRTWTEHSDSSQSYNRRKLKAFVSRLNPCCNEVVLPLVPLFVSLVPFHPSPIIKVTLYTVLLPRQVLPHWLNLMVLLFQVLLQGFQVFQVFFFDVTLQYLEDSVSTDSLRDSVYLVPAPVMRSRFSNIFCKLTVSYTSYTRKRITTRRPQQRHQYISSEYSMMRLINSLTVSFLCVHLKNQTSWMAFDSQGHLQGCELLLAVPPEVLTRWPFSNEKIRGTSRSRYVYTLSSFGFNWFQNLPIHPVTCTVYRTQSLYSNHSKPKNVVSACFRLFDLAWQFVISEYFRCVKIL